MNQHRLLPTQPVQSILYSLTLPRHPAPRPRPPPCRCHRRLPPWPAPSPPQPGCPGPPPSHPRMAPAPAQARQRGQQVQAQGRAHAQQAVGRRAARRASRPPPPATAAGCRCRRGRAGPASSPPAGHTGQAVDITGRRALILLSRPRGRRDASIDNWLLRTPLDVLKSCAGWQDTSEALCTGNRGWPEQWVPRTRLACSSRRLACGSMIVWQLLTASSGTRSPRAPCWPSPSQARGLRGRKWGTTASPAPRQRGRVTMHKQ